MKDTIQVFHDDYISQCQTTVLPLLEEIAMFRKDDPSEDRGKYLFSSKPSKLYFQILQILKIDKEELKLGNSLLRLVLECLWVWSKWFPIDPDTLQVSQYKIAFEKLIKIGVKFCKLEYFSLDEVYKHLPEQMIPIKILKECRSAIVQDIGKNGEKCPSRQIAQELYSNLRKEFQKDDENAEIFYADKIKRALQRRSTTPKLEVMRLERGSPMAVASSVIKEYPFRVQITQTEVSEESDQAKIKELNLKLNKINKDLEEQKNENERLQKALINQNTLIDTLKQQIDKQNQFLRYYQEQQINYRLGQEQRQLNLKQQNPTEVDKIQQQIRESRQKQTKSTNRN